MIILYFWRRYCNEADYILALKNNHKNLNKDVRLYLNAEYDKANHGILLSHRESDKGHGRIEERTCFVTDNIDWLVDKIKYHGYDRVKAHNQRQNQYRKKVLFDE